MLHLFDMFDESIAQELNVPVEEFIEVIESVQMNRAEAVCLGMLTGDDKKIEQAKRIYKLIIDAKQNKH